MAASSVPRATFDYLASLEWIRARENLVLVGPAGTGKSHLLVALGLAAVEAGIRVRYFAATDLVETLYRGLADNSVGRVIEGLLRNDLVIVDELGFAPLDDVGTQLLFRFVAAAYERRSLGVASHWPFESWGRFLPEHTTAVSLLDRLLHHAVGGRHRGRELPDAARPAREGVVVRRSPETRPGWGLLMATGGDFHMAIDRSRGPGARAAARASQRSDTRLPSAPKRRPRGYTSTVLPRATEARDGGCIDVGTANGDLRLWNSG